MKQRSVRAGVFFLCITISAMLTPASGWSDSENSCYSRGAMLGSAGISVYYFGVYAAFDYGIHDCISAGAAAGYNGDSRPGYRINQVPLMIRAAFHPFNLAVLADKIIIRDMVDLYAGITTGRVIRWETSKYDDLRGDVHSGFSIREYLGLRYHFSDKIAIFIEDCGETANLAFGCTYTF
jgi:hypothetical protein